MKKTKTKEVARNKAAAKTAAVRIGQKGKDEDDQRTSSTEATE
jgi:hypothetical protein